MRAPSASRCLPPALAVTTTRPARRQLPLRAQPSAQPRAARRGALQRAVVAIVRSNSPATPTARRAVNRNPLPPGRPTLPLAASAVTITCAPNAAVGRLQVDLVARRRAGEPHGQRGPVADVHRDRPRLALGRRLLGDHRDADLRRRRPCPRSSPRPAPPPSRPSRRAPGAERAARSRGAAAAERDNQRERADEPAAKPLAHDDPPCVPCGHLRSRRYAPGRAGETRENPRL